MKPPEILAMVEEAAGTKMYESKKNNAVKLIEKKDSKLSEIIDVCGPHTLCLPRARVRYTRHARRKPVPYCIRLAALWLNPSAALALRPMV